MLIVGLGFVAALGLDGAWVGYSILYGPIYALVGVSWLWLWRAFRSEADDRGWDARRRRRHLVWLLLFGPLYVWHLRQGAKATLTPHQPG